MTDLRKYVCWTKKEEVMDLFRDLPMSFYKEVAARILTDLVTPKEDNPIDVTKPTKFVYEEGFDDGAMSKVEYKVYPESKWDPYTVTMTRNSIEVEGLDETTNTKSKLLDAKYNTALLLYFQKPFNIQVTEEELEHAYDRG